MKKKISIFGSTGSIGKTTLSLLKDKKNYQLYILTANRNSKKIINLIKIFKPKIFIVFDFKTYLKIKKKFHNKNITILNSKNYLNFNYKKSDISIAAIPGIAGLKPTLELLKISKKILIANKESVICGWQLIKKIALKKKVQLIPIDSEHFSVMKLLQHENIDNLEKIYLTASGGPFLNFSKSKMKNIRPKQAINHPKWKMGKKISVDSSTLMNKMFELVEAQKLFNLPKNKIDILIHPNSLVHAIVEFKNGLTQFLYHETSMIIPIANAIYDGNLNIAEYLKKDNVSFEKNKIENLVFKKVDKKIFPSISLKSKINQYPSSPIIINAANEVLVDNFLRQKIPFLRIFEIIKTIMNDRNYKKYAVKKPIKIYQIKLIDSWARSITVNKIKLKR